MELEGNYNLIPPCYDSNIINTPKPNCSTGSPWNAAHAQKTMAGDLNGPTTTTQDEFHRVTTVDPVHLPYFVNGKCTAGDASCVIETV